MSNDFRGKLVIPKFEARLSDLFPVVAVSCCMSCRILLGALNSLSYSYDTSIFLKCPNLVLWVGFYGEI